MTLRAAAVRRVFTDPALHSAPSLRIVRDGALRYAPQRYFSTTATSPARAAAGSTRTGNQAPGRTPGLDS